jgi:signal transduction histidine kinase
MRRRLPLSAWLGLGLALAMTLPAAGGAAAWWAVEARQNADLERRADRAAALIAERPPTGIVDQALARDLAALDVEAELIVKTPTEKGPNAGLKAPDEATLGAIKREYLAGLRDKPAPMTAKLEALLRTQPDGKNLLQNGFVQRNIAGANLFLAKPGRSARVAGAGIAALVLLAFVLAAGYVLLRRWVVRPLARMSADLEQVAGGEVTVAPVASRAREVADIGAALNGMAVELRAALAERDAADEQRRFLVTAIAHDLRTPLFTLRGSLEAIEQGIGDTDHLQRAQDKAALLDGLVDDLFTYSRLEYAGPQLTSEPLDATALAREAAQTVDPRIIVVAPAGPVVLDGDRAALLRVLVNLLDNAVRHCRDRVELAVVDDRDSVAFVVTDDGPGIDPGDLPHLFEPLFRADRTRNSVTGGAGLGLAIVDRLTTAHGGTVTAGAAPGGGARFTVTCARRGAPCLRSSPQVRQPAAQKE